MELLSWLGVPAEPHGNVIEVVTGKVGIDEACSGIRSFQATLMISLFLGALYHLPWRHRLALVLGGFAMSFFFNLTRMSILVWVAAHQGIAAIARWHDPTGIAILLTCFLALWILSVLLAPRPARPPAGVAPAETAANSGAPPRLTPLLVALLAWFTLVAVSVEWWFRWHDHALPPATLWTVTWPSDNPTFKPQVISDRTRQILRFNEGQSATWSSAGIFWQVVYFRWEPGRTALHLAQNHTPEVCMTGAGNSVVTISKCEWLSAAGLQLPFLVCQLDNALEPTFIYYCLWDDRASEQGLPTMRLNYRNRLAPVLAGLRNPGQRSLEIMVTGSPDESSARRAVQQELEHIIQVGPPPRH